MHVYVQQYSLRGQGWCQTHTTVHNSKALKDTVSFLLSSHTLHWITAYWIATHCISLGSFVLWLYKMLFFSCRLIIGTNLMMFWIAAHYLTIKEVCSFHICRIHVFSEHCILPVTIQSSTCDTLSKNKFSFEHRLSDTFFNCAIDFKHWKQ